MDIISDEIRVKFAEFEFKYSGVLFELCGLYEKIVWPWLKDHSIPTY